MVLECTDRKVFRNCIARIYFSRMNEYIEGGIKCFVYIIKKYLKNKTPATKRERDMQNK